MADGINNFFQSLSGKLGNAIGNPVAQQRPDIGSGLIRQPFLQPQDLLSTVYTTSTTESAPQSQGGFLEIDKLSESIISFPGYNRTSGISPQQGNISNSNLQQLDKTDRFGNQTLSKPGFTPLEYFNTGGGLKVVTPIGSAQLDTEEYNLWQKESYGYNDINPKGDKRLGSFKYSYEDYVKFNSKLNDLEGTDGSNQRIRISEILKDRESEICYYDNEDPVYFGFEVIIDVDNSPLLNGQLKDFITGGYIPEIQSREPIYNQFVSELKRFVKFKIDTDNSDTTQTSKEIFETCDKPRMYYLKKISGLDTLVERNTGDGNKSFVDYQKDKITLNFFEDVSLNMGTLAILYKQLYWSRTKGKSIIPENLLRFDCQIVVSELRNMSRIKKSPDFIEIIRDNLSRYVYNVYECQFFFDKMSHPGEIDLSTTPTATSDYSVSFNFKFSNLSFERWNPPQFNGPAGEWRSVSDISEDPFSISNSLDPNDISKEYSTGLLSTSRGSNPVFFNNIQDRNTDLQLGTIDSLKNERKKGIYELSNSNPFVGPLQFVNNNDIYDNNVEIPLETTPGQRDIYGRAAEQLLENLKDAALNEAQRQLNIRFRLLNDSLDRIRNQFGLGRMPAPTNVYFPTQNTGPYGQSNVFFDVQNSLRNFGGDILTGLIGG